MHLLLITGGQHPYEESTPVLQAFINEAGHRVTLSESAEELAQIEEKRLHARNAASLCGSREDPMGCILAVRPN